jgi:hypothetical protein
MDKTRWNDIDRGTPDSSTRGLWKFYRQRYLIVEQEKHVEGSDEFCL